MNILYCEKCGLRVPDAPQDTPPGTVFCKDCIAKDNPHLGNVKLPPTQTVKGSGRQPKITPETGHAAPRPAPALSESPKIIPASRPNRSGNTGLILAAAGLTLGLAIGIMVAVKPTENAAKPEHNVAVRTEVKPPAPSVVNPPHVENTVPKTPAVKTPVSKPVEPQPPETKPDETKSVESTPAEPKPVDPKPATPAVDPNDPRETYAARQWAELQIKKPNVSSLAYWQSINTFVKTHGTTRAGIEAQEWLWKNPPPPPPPPALPAAQSQTGGAVQLSMTFEDDAELKYVKDSANEKVEGFGGKGRGLKSHLLENKQPIRATSLVIEFQDKIVPLSAGTWIRFAYKAQNIFNMRVLLTMEQGFLAQAFKFKLAEDGKWNWMTLKLTDFTPDGTPLKLPRASMQIKGIMIDGGRKGQEPNPILLIDNITIGDGPIPEPPPE